ncbi:hypothetical protein N752_30260 [Desulforamulus aquiferis]|nr:hypothetical protein N752_30260 [Desulforamulus aquiferis]
MGSWEYKDAVSWESTPMISSVFQYHNTLASFLGATILVALVLAVRLITMKIIEKKYIM